LVIEYCALLNAIGDPESALQLLEGRRFQPWEGGESMALGIFSQTQILLARKALDHNRTEEAKAHLESAIEPPESLGEARHILANASDLWLAYGDTLAASGDPEPARNWWLRAAEFKGDFQGMAIQPYSELTYFQALALRRLGRDGEARALLLELRGYAEQLRESRATIDYFATSLPTMLLFDDDLQVRQDNRARFILAQVASGCAETSEAEQLLREVLAIDPSHAMARDLLSRISSSHPSSQCPV
jgi:tetratricopeptide (TPR) repeat protein